jgi:hypothetical protein
MKILFNLFRHFTEVVFPALAVRYGWQVIHEKDIKVTLCKAIGMSVPVHPARCYTNTTDLKRLLTLCYDIEANPCIFLFL